METLLEKLQSVAAGCPPSLPLRLLVVADCAGKDGSEAVPVTTGDADTLLQLLQPRLNLSVENRTQKGGPRVPLALDIHQLSDFRPEALASHVKPAADGHAPTGEQLDDILHQPEFQRLEACWLGLDRLCKTVAGKPSVAVEVLPATRKNLKEVFHAKVFEPEYAGAPAVPLSAVYFDYRFSHEPTDLPLLEALAQDCATLQTPMIAAASPTFFQLKNLAHLPNLPDVATKFQLPVYANWRRFQSDPAARWVCVTANRFLAREPYALAQESGASFDYREKADAAHPEWYLWADAGWLVLCNLARSFEKLRHCIAIDGMSPEAAHFNLPTRPFPKKANVLVPSPTEVLIDDTKAWELVRAGFTMLVGISDGAVATFPLLANAYRLHPGVLTTESALSYQLMAGHLSHYLFSIYGQIPVAEGREAVKAFLAERLHTFLIPFAGEKPEETVSVEIVEPTDASPQRVLNVNLRPQLKLQGKDVDFTVQLAI